MIGSTLQFIPAGGTLVPYFLDEKKNWALSIESLKAAVKDARAEGKHVRGLVFINPGNPTGQSGTVMDRQDCCVVLQWNLSSCRQANVTCDECRFLSC